jgi:hypothetical protein
MKLRTILCCLLSSFILLPSAFPQGQLPPTGPPGPTMKTLDQVEARIPIDATHTPGDDTTEFIIPAIGSGSYYLTGNIKVSKATGIKVAASDVTIDLNGFSVQRTANSGGNGIRIEDNASGCVVKNGSIRGFESGVRAKGENPILSGAAAGRVHHMTVTSCSLFGILVGSDWEIEESVFYVNGFGISAEGGCTIKHCTVSSSTKGDGISLGSGSVLGCTSTRNKGDGIDMPSSGTIVDCLTESNEGNGIRTSTRSTISKCTSTFNGANGMSLGTSGVVNGCTVFGNDLDGIVTGDDFQILNNACSSNGRANGLSNGAGIHVTGGGSRIEGNNTSSNDIGVRVTGTGTGNLIEANHVRNNTGPGIEVTTVNGRNVIIRNVAGNNVNSYTGIASGNQVGPIDTNFTATSPFANFGN